MNTLSWLIYAGGVVDSLSVIVGITLIVGSIFAIATGIVGCVEDEPHLRALAVKVLLTMLTVGVVASFVPSKNTIYMIAASQAGERVVTDPAAKELMGDLREIIAKQIKRLKDDK